MNFITAVACVLVGMIGMGPIGAILGFLIWFVITTVKNK